MAKRRRRPVYNPLAPDPNPLKSAKRYVDALVNPMMKQITAQFDRQAAGGAGLISSYTKNLQAQLAGGAAATQQRYSQADTQLSAIDTALANRLSAAGQGQGSALAAKLAQAGIPQTTDLGQMGAGASAAGFAKGSAGRQALLTQGAAAADYSAALPGIAGLGGAQRLGDYSAQIANQRQNALESLRGKIPGMYQQQLGQIQNTNLQKAIAQQSGLLNTAKLAADMSQFDTRIATTVRGQNLSHQDRVARLKASKGKNDPKRQSAINNATGKAKSILDAAVKPIAAAGTPSAGSPFLAPGTGTKKRTVNYFGTVKKVAGVIRPILAPYMSNAEIIRFAQQLAASYYSPGQFGRPGRKKAPAFRQTRPG